ncbi:MAG: hypothetical protein H0X51_09065 [Parachlamydiaceae bacterium]|nr:hypothetical protein [Parachlamydiaceae bacterium]
MFEKFSIKDAKKHHFNNRMDFRKKSIHKRPVLLLEVLIAMALVALCMIPLIVPHFTLFQAHQKFSTTMQVNRTVNQLYVEVLDRLHKNEIPWSSIQERQSLPIDPLLEKLTITSFPYTGNYQFEEVKHKSNKSTGWSVYQLKVIFHLSPRNPGKNEEAIQDFVYALPLLRHQAPIEEVEDE